MTRELKSTLDTSGIQWPALRNNIPRMAHIIQLALGAFMSSLGVIGLARCWEAHECNEQFGENETIDLGKSQRLRKEGNAGINKVTAKRPELAKVIEKVRISRVVESPETDLPMAVNDGSMDYTDTGSSKMVDWRSINQPKNCSIT